MPSRPFPPPPPSSSSSSHHHHLLLLLPLLLTFSLLLSLLIFLLYLYFHHSSSSSSSSSSTSLPHFSHRKLRRATRNFSLSSSLGRGASATVFRGVIGSKTVAVKVFHSSTAHHFHNEVEAHSCMPSSSPFVVQLLGRSSKKDCFVLVYEYLPNKSLQEALRLESDHGPSSESSTLLSWKQRFRIILDVAKAIEFLHVNCVPPVIHGDIKPSNVLLESCYRAKIADFGLSRVKCEDKSETIVEKKKMVIEKSLELERSGGGEWWWRQDDGEVFGKDYVGEWIGSQICPINTMDSEEDNKSNNFSGKSEHNQMKASSPPKKEHKKMRDWWKEERYDEQNSPPNNTKIKPTNIFQCLNTSPSKSNNKYLSSPVTQKSPQSQQSWPSAWSGDLSTTSMRGTMCYVAPECNGKAATEKSDVYSFGVLLLVVVSGRRPIHVSNSPMKLEKANLVSWCRSLGGTGNVEEIVDERLGSDYNPEEARLCVNLALLCLQRSPDFRPDGSTIVRILEGMLELPVLPTEASPSPGMRASGQRKEKNGQTLS